MQQVAQSTGAESRLVPWWLVLLEGIGAVLIGVLLITDPRTTIYTLVVFLGAYFVVSGAFALVSIFLDQSHLGWKLFSGVIGILAGLVVIRHPLWASVVIPSILVWVLGIVGVVNGLIGIFRAFTGAGWGAAALGVLLLVFGVILLLNPVISLTVLVYLAGIWAIVGGILAIGAAFALRSRRAPQAATRPQTA